MEKPVKPKKQCVPTLLLLSVVLAVIIGLTNCEQNANLMQQPAVDCGEALFADSLFAGRTNVVCRDSTLRSALDNCPRVGLFLVPFTDVTWHPSGDFIAFFYGPMDRIAFQNGDPCRGGQRFIPNTQGYWFSQPDGSNMRRVRAPSFSTPAWSPDGQWLAFTSNAQIYKIRFTGECFDESSITQLTTQGRNFFPDWSPDGQWIAYDRSLADESGPAGIWIMKSDGSFKRPIAAGRYPDWHPNGNFLIYIGLHSEVYCVDRNDTSQVVRLTSLNQEDISATSNRHPQYSPDGSMIAFTSQPRNEIRNVWVMNSDGSNLHQLTIDGTWGWFDWSSDGRKIIYTRHRFDNWTYCNGTLWTVDVLTGEKRQITYHYLPNE